MNKQKILFYLCLVLLSVVVIGMAVTLPKKNMAESSFKAYLGKSYADVLYNEFQTGRSEQFPVVGHETSANWRIASIYNEEMFYLSFTDNVTAKGCYLNSLQEYGSEINGVMCLYQNDIVYYKGSDARIIEIINRATRENKN